MNSIKRSAALLLFSAIAVSLPFKSWSQKTGLHVLRTLKINSSGGWDYIRADGASKRIYVSHGNQVNILDAVSGDSVGYIPNTLGVHGIALAPEFGKGYVSAGRTNNVMVFDLKTNDTLGRVATGTGPDAIFYDEYSKKVITCNGRSKDATFIDAASGKVVATVPLGAKPETAVSDGKGKIFVNAENTNEVVVINANTFKIEARYKIEGGEEPSGLDIDTKTNRLFIGCGGSKTMVVMDATNGKSLAKFPIGDCDGLVFDPELKQAYSSNGEGSISVVKELSASKFVFVENIPTEKGARTIGIDVATHHLYLPTAQFGPAPAATAENAHPRPKMLPGTFHVIEVGK